MKNIAKIFGINLSSTDDLPKNEKDKLDKKDKTTDNKDVTNHNDNQADFGLNSEIGGFTSEPLLSSYSENQSKKSSEWEGDLTEDFGNYLDNLKKSTDSTGSTEAIRKVSISEVAPNPYQPRKTFDPEALAELTASIKEFGVIQPVIVRQKDGNKYELIAGERRLRASKEAGLLELPVIVRNLSDKEVAELAMIENLQREDLHFLEEAEGFSKLISSFGFTQEELASRMGKNQSTIANKLRLLKLPDKVRRMITAQALTERHARALLRLDDENAQLEILKIVNQKKLNVRQTEELIEKYLESISREKEATPKQTLMKIIKDVRIYINTINSIAGQMQKNGMDVNCQQEFDGEYVTITMKIKNNKKQ